MFTDVIAGAALLVLAPFFVRLDDLFLGSFLLAEVVAGAAAPSACSNVY